MAKERSRLKLGKRAAFVKTHLKQLPRQQETWEADYLALPKPPDEAVTPHLGLAVALPRGDPLVYRLVDYPPTVNDLADLLADAMRRPLTGPPRRPERIHFRANPRWEELFRHLKELGIEVSLQDDLPELEAVYLDFRRQTRMSGAAPIIMLSPGPADVGRQFPAIGEWVRESGWIEVGRREGKGIMVRALDHGGLVFEDGDSNTLAEAFATLEEALAERLGGQEAPTRSPSPWAEGSQRRRRHDA